MIDLNEQSSMRWRNGQAPGRPSSHLLDARKFNISLKQWRILHAVIECGGFADAAETLHLSQSTISYTLTKMQEQLGVPILQMVGRKAYLTEHGRALLERSRFLLKDALELEQLAENMRLGSAPRLKLVVDNEYPSQLLMPALRKFSMLCNNVKISLSEVSALQAEQALHERRADLAIIGQIPAGFIGEPLIELAYVAVAAPGHFLSLLGRDITVDELEDHVQIIVGGAEPPAQGDKRSVPPRSPQCWNVSSFDTAVNGLREGLGYAWLPICRIQNLLAQGELSILRLAQGETYKRTLYIIHGRHSTSHSTAGSLCKVLSQSFCRSVV